MRKRREKVSVKAAAIILGAALLTAGCSGYQSSEELRKNAENVQAEIVPGEENETENGSDEAIGEKAEKENTFRYFGKCFYQGMFFFHTFVMFFR